MDPPRGMVNQRGPDLQTPRWDIPLRMTVATLVVLAITTLAPIIGPHLAGLLLPFPVFAVVLALFTHSSHGPTCAVAVLDGLIIGLAALPCSSPSSP